MVIDKFTKKELYSHMEQCILLAAKSDLPGLGRPYVGSRVISSEGNVIGEGYKSFVEYTNFVLHAERAAIQSVEYPEDMVGGIIITTLEPCIPQFKSRRNKKEFCIGEMPKTRSEKKQRVAFARKSRRSIPCSCAELIVDSGLESVIYSVRDNCSVVRPGEGAGYLEKQGVQVFHYKNKKMQDIIKEYFMPLDRRR